MRINIYNLSGFIIDKIGKTPINHGFNTTTASHGVSLNRKGKYVNNRVSFVLNHPFSEVEALGFCAFIGYPIVDKIADTILVKHDILGSGVFLDDSNTFSPPLSAKTRF